MTESPCSHADAMVLVVNTINRRTQSIAADEVDLFLKKHKLFRLVEVEEPEESKRKPRKPVKKQVKPVKEEKPDPVRKRRSPETSLKSSPSPSEPDIKRRRPVKEVVVETPPARPNPLIVMSLKEMHDIIRLFTSSPPGCVDWEMISHTSTGGRVPAADVEYAANEFLPHVHYRPSVGMVVMERMSRIPTEYQKHRQTMKRMRQSLGQLVSELKRRLSSEPEVLAPVKAEEEPMLITPEMSPDEVMEDQGETPVPIAPVRPGRRPGPGPDLASYVSWLPPHVVEELRQRAAVAISRLEQGQVPTYALRTTTIVQADAEGLTATGRIRKRYETKAMRLAKEAAMPSAAAPLAHPPVVQQSAPPQYEAPPFFMATARQFSKSVDE